MIGLKFGNLTVLRQLSEYIFECQCKCGGVSNYHINTLKYRNNSAINCKKCMNKTTHGLSHHPLYSVWISIISKCENPSDNEYPSYGGKGIKVCDRWKKDINNFIEDVGYRPTRKHVFVLIDRSKNYDKSNCKWITMSENFFRIRNIKKSHEQLTVESHRDTKLTIGANMEQVQIFTNEEKYKKMIEECIKQEAIIVEKRKKLEAILNAIYQLNNAVEAIKTL